jgi:hypothetical protein
VYTKIAFACCVLSIVIFVLLSTFPTFFNPETGYFVWMLSSMIGFGAFVFFTGKIVVYLSDELHYFIERIKR